MFKKRELHKVYLVCRSIYDRPIFKIEEVEVYVDRRGRYRTAERDIVEKTCEHHYLVDGTRDEAEEVRVHLMKCQRDAYKSRIESSKIFLKHIESELRKVEQ